MDVIRDITKRVESLPPAKQEQVLSYVTSLTTPLPAGARGADLLRFAGTLHAESVREMMQAIEEECERIDVDEW